MRRVLASAVFNSVSLCAVSLFSSVGLAVDVPQWSVFNLAYTGSNTPANPYTQTSVAATFSGPNGVTQTVHGFYDGDNVFRIRFNPAVQGTWSYTTSSSDTGLNNQSGTFQCTAPNPGDHGFVRVNADYPSSFVYDDGTPYFMWGTTYYDTVQGALAGADWKTALDKVAGYGINKVRLHLFAQQEHWANATSYSLYPDAIPYYDNNANLMSPDRDVLNIDYWKKFDEIVEYLDSRGMKADIIVTNPYRSNRMFGTDAQNDRFVEYAIARYAAYDNVLWTVANEYNWSPSFGGSYPQDKADFNRMGLLLRNDDPFVTSSEGLRRPLSTHQKTQIGFDFFDQTWPTHAIIQYGVRRSKSTYPYGDQWGNAGIVYNLGHNMPVVNDEYGYFGEEIQTGVVLTRADNRNIIWGIASAGGYGTAGDMRLFSKGYTFVSGQWVEPDCDLVEYSDIQRMIDFFTTQGIEYWKMSSQNGLTSTARTYVLAEMGRQYVIYSATGGTFSVNLAAGTYNAWRFDPAADGEGETNLGTIAWGGGVRSFTLSSAHDWVVYLTPVPEPGAMTLLGVGLVGSLVCRWRQRRHAR